MSLKTQFTHFVLAAWLTAITAVALTLPCVGQGVIYTSRSAFETAIVGLPGGRRDVDFEGPCLQEGPTLELVS